MAAVVMAGSGTGDVGRRGWRCPGWRTPDGEYRTGAVVGPRATIRPVTLAPNDFTHLHVHSEFSLLDGLGRITELVDAAAAAGMN